MQRRYLSNLSPRIDQGVAFIHYFVSLKFICNLLKCFSKVFFVKEAKPYQILALNLYPVDKITKIHFENASLQEIFEKLLVHICYTCPMKPTFQNLQILKDHLRKEHELFFCDLCVENLKVIILFLKVTLYFSE